MDSLTQIVLGAACGEVVLGKKIGNKALFFGAIGGTLPDLDVFVGKWFYSNEIQAMAFHRGFMHSIPFAAISSILLGYFLFWSFDRGSRKGLTTRKNWISLFFWSIFTHPILDCFTAYGTQLFAPFSSYRVAFDNISVADPLYTVPFLLSLVLLLFFKRNSKPRRTILNFGIVVSSLYMLTTFINKTYISTVFKSSLENQKIVYSRFRCQPTILNNVLWYGIAESNSDYYVALYSIFDESDYPKKWQRIPKNHNLIPTNDKDIQTLIWFSNGFYSVTESAERGVFIFKDLRYPLMDENDPNSSVFSFSIEKVNERWIAAPFYPENPDEDDVLNFWNRIKGI